MTWAWRVGRIAGINLYIHVTFLMLLGWVALTHYLQRRTVVHHCAVQYCRPPRVGARADRKALWDSDSRHHAATDWRRCPSGTGAGRSEAGGAGGAGRAGRQHTAGGAAVRPPWHGSEAALVGDRPGCA